MFAYISGIIGEKNISNVVIDVHGVGYQLEVSLHTYSQIEALKEVKLYTYFYVREDAQIIFGFADKEEKILFLKLISVSGIGTNTARMMLSSLSPVEIKKAIVEGDEDLIKSIKGIGAKTAKRLIVDLKDALEKEELPTDVISVKLNNTMTNQALSALLALGFSKSNGTKAINMALKEKPNLDSVESLIKTALKNL